MGANVTLLGEKVSSPETYAICDEKRSFQIFNGTLSLQTRACDGWLPCTTAGLSEGCGCRDVALSAGLHDSIVPVERRRN